MTVFTRGGTFWYEFWDGGRRYRKSTGVKNQRAAEKIERAFRTALANGDVGITERKPIPTFRPAMKDFLGWSKGEHTAHPRTHQRCVTSSIALLQHFRDSPLDKITPAEAEQYKTARLNQFKTVRAKDAQGERLRKITDKKIQPATVNRELACLRAMFNHAIKGGSPVTNPISKTGAKALHEDNEQTRVLTYDEQEKYLTKATLLLRDIATLMLETGMRPEEVYRIQPAYVHLAENYLFNPFGKTKAAKRRIRLTAAAKSVLARRMKGLKTPFVFPCETDDLRPVPKVNNAHDRAVKASKVAPFRLYDLRHTWATRAAMSGIDLVTLAAMLGHSKINMVLRYAHPTQEHQTQAMEKMEQYVAQQMIVAAQRSLPDASQTIQ